MEKDLDKKLYNDYLDGQKEAFEFLYNKYKKRIEYFVFNIVKDYQKAEDITQETFIYVMQNKMKENVSFKYYIYMVAKSRAINYIKIEKRRTEITEKYLYNFTENIEKDFSEIDKVIVKNESIIRGNFSLPCFKFANEFKDKPENIATKIKEKLNLDYIEKNEVIGGFLNIYIKNCQ